MNRLAAALIIAATLAGGAYAGTRLHLETDVTRFLPDGEDRDALELARAVAASELGRTFTLAIRAPDDSASLAARSLAAALRSHPEVASVRAGDEPSLDDSIHTLYWPRRLLFLDPDPVRSLPRRLNERALRASARDLRAELAGPTGSAISRIAPEDPLLAYPAILRRLDAARPGGVTLEGGHFVGTDHRSLLLFVTTRHSAFATGPQAPLQAHLERAITRARARTPGLVVERAGAHHFAVETERRIRDDVVRISLVSTLGILLLYIVVFRSARGVLLTLLPIAIGLAGSLIVSAVAFERLHAITFAFGASLIGVCEDYPTHLLQLHAFSPAGTDPRVTVRRTFVALLLGAGTTAAGLGGLAFGGHPAMIELAVFGAAGITAAFAATVWLVPPFLGPARPPTPVQTALATAGTRLLSLMRRRRVIPASIAVAALGVAAIGLPRLDWSDDLASLQAPDPQLVAEDRRVRALARSTETSRFAVTTGATTEAALTHALALDRALTNARIAGDVAGHRSLTAFLWPIDTQFANGYAIHGTPDLAETLATAFTAEGFTPDAFAPFAASLRVPPSARPEPLVLGDLQGSALAPLVAPFRISLDDGRIALLTFLEGPRRIEPLARRIDAVPHSRFIDTPAITHRALRAWRERALDLLAIGVVAILVVCLLRYRKPRLALAACLPCLLAAGATLGTLALAGIPASPIQVLALLLVLALGVDYGIFVVEHRTGEASTRAALAGIALAGATTILSFGTLALSTSPALRDLGLSLGLGVLLSMLLAPAALALLDPAEAP